MGPTSRKTRPRRQEDPLAAAGIPDWLRDQFAVPKLPPEPVVRAGQRKVKVATGAADVWALWARVVPRNQRKLIKRKNHQFLGDWTVHRVKGLR